MSRKLMVALKNAKTTNKLLMEEYICKWIECHENNDTTGRNYWHERYFQLMRENDSIEMDIRKLKKGDDS